MSADPSPFNLWQMAHAEFPDNANMAHHRYIALAVEHGMIVTTIDELLSPEEHAELNAGLARIAATRRRAEAESRNIVISGGTPEGTEG